jgi:hypothetical protein
MIDNDIKELAQCLIDAQMLLSDTRRLENVEPDIHHEYRTKLAQKYVQGAEVTKKFEWTVLRLYDAELITASRACELLNCKQQDFNSLYINYPGGYNEI